jgi:hypothetical protein
MLLPAYCNSLEATLINFCGIEAESLGMSTGR